VPSYLIDCRRAVPDFPLKTIKRRLYKKLHRRRLDVFGDEVTFSPHWRALLFTSEEGVTYTVDGRHLDGLKPNAVAILKKYDLHF
jgi:hypothetical protein